MRVNLGYLRGPTTRYHGHGREHQNLSCSGQPVTPQKIIAYILRHAAMLKVKRKTLRLEPTRSDGAARARITLEVAFRRAACSLFGWMAILWKLGAGAGNANRGIYAPIQTSTPLAGWPGLTFRTVSMLRTTRLLIYSGHRDLFTIRSHLPPPRSA